MRSWERTTRPHDTKGRDPFIKCPPPEIRWDFNGERSALSLGFRQVGRQDRLHLEGHIEGGDVLHNGHG